MNKHRITLLGSQDARLRKWLEGDPEGNERGAIVLLRKFDRAVRDQKPSIRFVVIDVIEMTNEWVIESTTTSLRINMRKLPELYFRCEQEHLELGFVHSHPSGHPDFSDKDDLNEQNILHGFASSNGPDVFLVAMVLSDGKWSARCRHGADPSHVQDIRHTAIVGERLQLDGVTGAAGSNEIFKRQEAAFGKPFNKKLQSLRVVVVGAGGTGSSTATLLARAGVGELIIVDGDDLEDTNLNRVRGHRLVHVGKNKAKVLAEFIHSMGLQISVSSIGEYIGESPKAIDAISGADIVFGCTDDVAGRDLLNQALYYYGLVYIDTGLTGKIDRSPDGEPYLRDHRGRVSCILPEHGACLRCQGVVTDMKLKYEKALEERPELATLDPETLKREYYLVGGGEHAPGVGPFTSATADAAVATLMDLIKPFRKLPSDLRQDNIWHDFVHMTIHSNAPAEDANCIYCKEHSLLLKREGAYRLEMPALGKLK
ncbi:ThiF family adenylyltransferase [Bradyrhizobium sp. 197]|uniref:ThiF family adenylyltransferase n=1 Tax=Bradyrhizobium sp. 197 TaxID=2782663 RepID=UPI001FFB3FC7|nr:ThiF family adenylyltransferase [Bradyrhizobium sp. 197]MCK1481012.1 ThiF family adenylyltransferase [Bradyrhizobium sp. 197]